MKRLIQKHSVRDVILVLICGVILCYTGFVNKFPLVYSDTGTYIGSGFSLNVPGDRPIFYGLFLRHVSLLTSLWLVIWVQGILLALVVFYYFKYLSGTTRYRFYYLLYIILITFFTAASSNVSQLIADIFTPISILSLGLLLFADMKKRDLVITTILLIFSIAVHSSHLYINALLLSGFTIIFIIRRFREELKAFSLNLKRIIFAWIVIVCTYFIVCSVNASLGSGFAYSKNGHIFLMARLADDGILGLYLHDNCDKHHYILCEYKDKLPWDFLWDYANSPLYKSGNGWSSPQTKEEYNAIFRDLFTSPKYCHLFIVKSIESTVRQFFCFGTGDSPPQGDGSAPFHEIIAHYPMSYKEYVGAHQLSNTLELKRIAVVQSILFGISLFFCMSLLLYPRLAGKFRWIILFILFGMLINAFICGSFSIVLERYQTRVVWLLPLPLILVMANREFFVSFVQKIFRKDT
jgi:hypothetical protein